MYFFIFLKEGSSEFFEESRGGILFYFSILFQSASVKNNLKRDHIVTTCGFSECDC